MDLFELRAAHPGLRVVAVVGGFRCDVLDAAHGVVVASSGVWRAHRVVARGCHGRPACLRARGRYGGGSVVWDAMSNLESSEINADAVARGFCMSLLDSLAAFRGQDLRRVPGSR